MQPSPSGLRAGLFSADGVRWRIAVLLLFMTALNFMDRQAFAVAIPVLREEFSLTASHYGIIASGFLASYAAGQAIAGRVLDRFGTRRSLAWAVVLWSIAGMLHVFGRGFWSFLAFRSLLGIFEGFNFPGAMKAVAHWFPRQERALGANIMRLGVGIGALLSPPLFGYVIYAYGWQAAFLLPGIAGFIWLIFWLTLYQDVEAHPRVSAAEKAHIQSGQITAVSGGPGPSWRLLLKSPALRGLMAARFFADNTLYFFLFWLPLYLTTERGFSLTDIALFAWIPFLSSDLGGLFVGWLSGALIKRGWTLEQVRKRLLWLAGVLVPFVAFAAIVESASAALALVSFGLFVNQFKTTSLFTLPTDIFPPQAVGTAWGMCGAAGSVGAMLFQPAIGWITDTVSYEPVFAIVSVLPLIAAILVSLCVTKRDVEEGALAAMKPATPQ
jgi:ACS family hexuronate transporter-like MFS transporter